MKQTNNFTRRSVAALTVLVTMTWCGAGADNRLYFCAGNPTADVCRQP